MIVPCRISGLRVILHVTLPPSGWWRACQRYREELELIDRILHSHPQTWSRFEAFRLVRVDVFPGSFRLIYLWGYRTWVVYAEPRSELEEPEIEERAPGQFVIRYRRPR
jgi:hypothetical protein